MLHLETIKNIINIASHLSNEIKFILTQKTFVT